MFAVALEVEGFFYLSFQSSGPVFPTVPLPKPAISAPIVPAGEFKLVHMNLFRFQLTNFSSLRFNLPKSEVLIKVPTASEVAVIPVEQQTGKMRAAKTIYAARGKDETDTDVPPLAPASSQSTTTPVPSTSLAAYPFKSGNVVSKSKSEPSSSSVSHMCIIDSELISAVYI